MSSNLSQHMLVSFQFVVRPGFDGYSLFQQIEDHLADSADLISVGMSTCHDVCSNWIPSKHSVGRGVVVVIASSSTSAATGSGCGFYSSE